MSALADKIIKAFEGLRLKAYLCSNGVWTIGWGHTGRFSDPGFKVVPGLVINVAQAQYAYSLDKQAVDEVVTRNVRAPLTANQRAAILSFVFNLGESRFRKSTLLKLINRRNYAAAAEEFGRWVHVRDEETGVVKKDPGLVTRRALERELFLQSS